MLWAFLIICRVFDYPMTIFKYCVNLAFKDLRSTMKSKKPCSKRNSERLNPSGRSFQIVSFTTRGPANPINALGSAILISPSIA